MANCGYGKISHVRAAHAMMDISPTLSLFTDGDEFAMGRGSSGWLKASTTTERK
jgi:hypothetical protein